MSVEQPLSVEMKFADGIFVKSIHVHEAGTSVPQHSHAYDHLSLLAAGTISVREDGVWVGEHSAPHILVIKAGVKHLFTALTDGVVIFCVHNTSRAEVVEVLDEHHLHEET